MTSASDDSVQTIDAEVQLQRNRRKHQQWWSLAILFTIVCTIAPLLMKGKLGSAVWVVGMMAFGAVLGSLSHNRPWRFGLVLSIAFIVEAMLVGGVGTIYDLMDKLRFGVTISIPAFIGSYGGAFVRKLIRHHIHLTGEPESIRYWKAAAGFGTAAGVLTIIASSAGEVPVPAMALLAGAATAISYLKPQRLWRWVIALVPGLPLAVILRIIVDISRVPTSHDLYPLEVGIACIYSIVPVLGGVLIGRFIKTGSIARPSTEYPTY
jgi:hypothetical protein